MNAVFSLRITGIYRGIYTKIDTKAVTVHRFVCSLLFILRYPSLPTHKMLTATPTQFHRRFFTWYFRRHARKLLAQIRMRGGEKVADWNRERGPGRPLLIIANHSSWWDAVMPILLSLDKYNHDAYGIMEERQLRRYGFFRKLGMFSIDRENFRSAKRSLDYAAELLRETDRVLWLFPQGEIVPNDRRPIHCYSGTAHLIQRIGTCAIVPVAFRYELLREERPIALVSVGEIEEVAANDGRTIPQLTEHITALLTAQADRLRDDFCREQLEEFDVILRGKGSINNRWDKARGRS